MTFKAATAADLLTDVREGSRKALASRLLAHAHPDVRNQLLAAVTQHVRGLNDRQLTDWHILLDHQEPS